MTNITIYDEDDKRLDAISDQFDVMPHEIIEALLDAVDDGVIDLSDYL